MFDKETLTALQEGTAIIQAQRAMEISEDTHNTVALPSDYKLHDLEKLLPARRRARGVMTTAILDSFIQYAKGHAENGATVFVDSANMSATAILNLGSPISPGHADNKAHLEIKRTAAFSAMLNMATGAGLTQAATAEFLEDWPDQIKCHNESGPIATSKAVTAIRKLIIETMRKLESEEQQLSASRSAFESVQATSKEPIPTLINFTCQPYPDLTERTFALRLSVKTPGDKPVITLRIVKVEQHNEDMAQELAAMISAGFDEAVPVVIGKYTKAE